ncbi:MgtC/SapB family protein [Clostridium sp. ZS2-4]|uniref:MgtC/SapB family protein n=1 Tax=Clostridium sp. ZS2-4 TaxID=2987703 RepID=UPI002279FD98|nr:MgtC/SapB family protein [Clostridium sp. ZS2-4]MCY6355616.1 MgtC/SapB family protein [Clostridium sp. ZS2-4]
MQWQEVIIRLGLAIVVGGLIGYEREFKNRPAGFRTHILVCVGAAVISMIQVYMVEDTVKMIAQDPQLANALKADIGRIGAQVVTGVGFLGAGTIIRDKGSVKGLTTAATIWVVACIGLAVGMGYYLLSIFSAIGVYGVLASLKKFEGKLFAKTNVVKIEMEYYNKKDLVDRVSEYFEIRNIKVKNIEFSLEEDSLDDEENNEVNEEIACSKKSLYTILIPRYIKPGTIVQDLSVFEEIIRVTII